ncbi:unnamed protein product [Mytilus edulis]|uniref:G-protein coupled receptors family 1 profile domain-containing protein n=1 Tax=Mytilus edulis TaxID=6550 RepID=A0A8S3VR99_MYTED|nr:unnamed protein product [Mytilus edulis]
MDNDEYYNYGYYDLNSTCPDGYYMYTLDTIGSWSFHVGAAMAYIIAIFNVLVVYMFIKTKNITPTTVIFIGLAFTDTLSALFLSLPRHYGIIMNYISQIDTLNSKIRYEYCTFLIIAEGPLFFAIHDVSIFFTTMLGVIKSLAIQFPIWFKINVGKRIPVMMSLIFLATSISLEMHPVLTFSFQSDLDGWCCNNEAYSTYFYEYSVVGQWVLPIIYLTAFITMIITTGFIVGKLTCCRSSISMVQISDAARQRFRRVSIIVVIITVVFIISEILDFVLIISPLLVFVFGLPDVFESKWYSEAFRYQRLILETGMGSLFFIYLTTSNELRNNLKGLLTCKTLLSRSKNQSTRVHRKQMNITRIATTETSGE